MQVQLNTTTNSYQNPNFNAKFSKSAQAYMDKEMKYLEERSHDVMYGRYYIECKNFAKEIIEDIKNLKPKGKDLYIDIFGIKNPHFICYKYENALDTLAGDSDMSLNNPLINVLIDLKNNVLRNFITLNDKEDDDKRYNEICKLLRVRPDDDFRVKWIGDVRDQGISIKDKPWKLKCDEGWDNKKGEYYQRFYYTKS